MAERPGQKGGGGEKKVTALLLIRKRGGKGRRESVVGTTLAVRSQFAVCSLLSAARQIAPSPPFLRHPSFSAPVFSAGPVKFT